MRYDDLGGLFSKKKSKKDAAYVRVVLSFLVLYVALLLTAMARRDSGLLPLYHLVVLHHLVSFAADRWTLFLRRDPHSREYPYPFGLHRVPTLIRLGGVVFLSAGCVAQLGELGHHMSTRASHHLQHHVDTSAADEIFSVAPHRSAGEVFSWLLTIAYAVLLLVYRDVIAQSDAVVGSMTTRFEEEPHGGTRRKWSVMRLLALFALPLFTVTSNMVSVAMSYWATDVSCLFASLYFLYRCYRAGSGMSALLLNKGIASICPKKEIELGQVLGQIALVEGVVEVARHAWWQIHGRNTFFLLQVRVLRDADAGLVASRCRRLLEDSICSQAFVECDVTPPCDSSDLQDWNGSGSYNEPSSVGSPEFYCCSGHSHGHHH